MKVHAGETVKEYFEASGLSVSEFARRLNCHRQNVYDIFKRQNIDLSLLQRISRVLEHDFVTELYGSSNNTKITLKFAVTVELENGECKVTEVKAVK
jgi:transcriptional regulator with XRE-family HTH domain